MSGLDRVAKQRKLSPGATRSLVTLLVIILLGQTIYSWWCYYQAQFLVYDDNYGLIIHGFLMSLFMFLGIVILWIWNKYFIRSVKYPLIVWSIFGSPVSFIIAALNYNSIFGNSLSG